MTGPDKFRKTKQILAVAAIVVILALYLFTLGLAIFGSENTKGMLFASLAATVVIPTLLYIYTWLYKVLLGKRDEQPDDEGGHHT